MIEYPAFAAASAHVGALTREPRNCWSASPDGSTVVLAFWDAKRQWDGFTQNIMQLDRDLDGSPLPWTAAPGNRMRKRHIEQALAADGRIRAVLVRSINPAAGPFESLARRNGAPITSLGGWFRITDHAEETGAFRAEPMA